LDESINFNLLSGRFSLRGELMHAFVCYRYATDGPEGNGLAGLIAERTRGLSLQGADDLTIPRHGWGVWPKSATARKPFRPEEAKVFLDKECLQDGQSWLAGFVNRLTASMVFVPLLSWTADDRGSVGDISRLGVGGFDKVDHVLLELIIAAALREEPSAGIQAVLPVLVGPERPAKEGGGFEVFPFYKLYRLSDEPSKATNARAGQILRHLGLGEGKVLAVEALSVKQVLEQVLRNQGVQASEWGDVERVATECATRVLKTVLHAIKRVWQDPTYFEQGRPMGSEVLSWLKEANLQSYAPLFIHHNLDSLEYVARINSTELSKLCEEHEELNPRSGRKGEIGGQLKKLELAHGKLVQSTAPRCLGLVGARVDQRTLPLSQRLESFRDDEASAMAIATSGNGLELVHTKTVARWTWAGAWTSFAMAFIFNILGFTSWGARESWLLTHAISALAVGFLPLASRTARQFVDLFQVCLNLYFIQAAAELVFEWGDKLHLESPRRSDVHGASQVSVAGGAEQRPGDLRGYGAPRASRRRDQRSAQGPAHAPSALAPRGAEGAGVPE